MTDKKDDLVNPEKEKKPLVTREDVFLTRDEDGNLDPIEVPSPLFGRNLRLVPMTYGFIKKHNAEMGVPAVEWDMELKIQMVRDHYVSPDLSDLTVEQAENDMDPITLNHLVSTLVASSTPFFRLRDGRRDMGVAEYIKAMEGISPVTNYK